MKRLTKIVVFAALLGLLGSTLPQTGFCSMPVAMTEDCPCCQPAQDKAPACPMMKAQPSRDLIGMSTISLTPIFEIIAVLDVETALVSSHRATELVLQPQIPKDFFYRTPQIGPAPPSLEVLA